MFGIGHPSLELAGHGVELGLSVETKISGRALANQYYVWPGGFWWSSILGGSDPTPGQNTKTLLAHSSEETKERKKTDRTLEQMVKTNLYRQNHTKNHTHTHSQKEKKGEKKYIYIHIKG